MVSLAQVSIFGIAGFALGNAVTNGNSKGLNLGWNPWWGVHRRDRGRDRDRLPAGRAREPERRHLLPHDHAHVRRDRECLLRGEPEPLGLRRDQRHRGAGVHRERQRASEPALLRSARGRSARLRSRSDTSCERRSGWRCRASATTRCAWARSGSTSPSTERWPSASPGSSRRSAASSSSGGTATSIPLRSTSVPRSICSSSASSADSTRLEGAWLGALAFVVIQNYVRTDDLPVVGGTFHTMIGVIFLLIVLVSPGGLMGIWDSLLRRFERPPQARRASAGRAMRLRVSWRAGPIA